MSKIWMKLKSIGLMRGESAVASVGIAGAAILLAALAACGWWTLQQVRLAQVEARAQQAQVVGSLLSQSAEPLLESGDLTAVRRLIVDAGRNYGLSRCRIVLAEGQIIADAKPNQINVRTLPSSWSVGASELPTPDPTVASLSFPLRISGRGGARLEIAQSLIDPHWVFWEEQSGIALIGAVALSLLLLVYRRSRAKLGAVGVIREALLEISAGETAAETLIVDPQLGEEAAAWNRMLNDQQQMKKQAMVERTIERLDARRGIRSDSDAAWDALPQGLVLVNADLSVRAANGGAAVLLKHRREEIPGRSIADLIKDEKVLDAIRSVASGSTQRPLMIESQRQGDAGIGVLRFAVRPVRKDDTASAMLIIEDVTQQRVAEQSRNSFIAQVTHELRTPLTNIRLYVETAIDDDASADPAVRSNCLNIINQETRRLERIVGEMLSVAEIEAGSFKVRRDDVYIDVMLKELEGEYAAQAAEKKITLKFIHPPKLPKLQGDRDKINLALHNLLGNALKYTPAEGQVTVSIDVRNGQLIIDVIDTGIGIKPEEAEKIFDKFYRSEDPRVEKITGTGLGLTLAREVVRLHGGDVTLQSELNRGSTFTATFPIPAEAA
jgi:signal transduction histidine kinase